MYSLPVDFNLSQFKGATVQQVCFAANIISIMLENEKYISFEGEFILSNQSGESIRFEVYPIENDFGLLKLLEQKIKEILVDKSNNNLFIEFDNQISLIIIASDNYESYSIKANNNISRI